MPPYGEPDWTTPGDTSHAATSNAGIPAAAPAAVMQNGNSAEDRNQARCIVLALSILNLVLSGMMGALGILSLIAYSPSKVKDLTEAFLSIYMTIFASLLFTYEFMWWQPVAKLNIMFRKNFGFLYGLKGKGFYLIFIAFLTIGLVKDDSTRIDGLDWATGIGWLVGGFLHLFVACTKPEVNSIYKPPTAGLASMGDAEGSSPV